MNNSIDSKDNTGQSERDRQIANSTKNIPGWGVDANPENDPTYPMKHTNGADHQRLEYEKPQQQPVTVEILKSNERPQISRVFGTSTPPKGLSGQLRRYAFRYSESSYGHWFPLILADRIDVVEGLIDDIKHGIIPNIFAEKGWQTEWKYNRKSMVQKIAVATVVVAAIVTLMSSRKKKKKQSFSLN